MNSRRLLLVSFVALISCSPKIKSMVALNDHHYFSEPPTIITISSRYFIHWRFGQDKFAFAMFAYSKPMDGKLLIFIPVTTSTGSLQGRVQLNEIIESEDIDLVRQNKVFWVEPDGTRVPLTTSEPTLEDMDLIARKAVYVIR